MGLPRQYMYPSTLASEPHLLHKATDLSSSSESRTLQAPLLSLKSIPAL